MIDSNLGLGVVLVLFVLLIPKGLVPTVRALAARFIADRRAKAVDAPEHALATETRS